MDRLVAQCRQNPPAQQPVFRRVRQAQRPLEVPGGEVPLPGVVGHPAHVLLYFRHDVDQAAGGRLAAASVQQRNYFVAQVPARQRQRGTAAVAVVDVLEMLAHAAQPAQVASGHWPQPARGDGPARARWLRKFPAGRPEHIGC
jgi:hypothetical protein